MAYIGTSPTQAVRTRFLYTATASQTTFSGADTQNLKLRYSDANFVDVYQNGVLLMGGGADYTATTTTSVVLATGATADDVIEIIVYDVFAVANLIKKDGDTVEGVINFNGKEITLDADFDTSITADTDDQIDIKIAGADDFRFTANTFTILSGSTLVNSGNAIQSNAGITIDDITIDGTEIDLSSGDLTIDVAGDITLDADGGDIIFKDGGSTFGTLTNNSGTFLVNANTNITTRAGVHTFDNTDGSSEYMRIDSSGNLFVGKTSSASATVGFEYNNAGQLAVTRSGDTVALLNRTSSDGNILDIRKDNTLVGSIGSVSGTDIELNSTLSGSLSAGGTKRFGWNTSGVFFPHTDNANDLGASGSRFKDLYLSGGLLVGGTGSANKLDDYEEGTWSPTHASGAGSGSFSNALYTKVGRLVHIALSFAFTGASGGLVIGNLPFTANNHSAGIGREDVTNGFTVHTMVTVNTTQINVRGSFATGNPSAYAVSAGTFRISLTYTTDS